MKFLAPTDHLRHEHDAEEEEQPSHHHDDDDCSTILDFPSVHEDDGVTEMPGASFDDCSIEGTFQEGVIADDNDNDDDRRQETSKYEQTQHHSSSCVDPGDENSDKYYFYLHHDRMIKDDSIVTRSTDSGPAENPFCSSSTCAHQQSHCRTREPCPSPSPNLQAGTTDCIVLQPTLWCERRPIARRVEGEEQDHNDTSGYQQEDDDSRNLEDSFDDEIYRLFGGGDITMMTTTTTTTATTTTTTTTRTTTTTTTTRGTTTAASVDDGATTNQEITLNLVPPPVTPDIGGSATEILLFPTTPQPSSSSLIRHTSSFSRSTSPLVDRPQLFPDLSYQEQDEMLILEDSQEQQEQRHFSLYSNTTTPPFLPNGTYTKPHLLSTPSTAFVPWGQPSAIPPPPLLFLSSSSNPAVTPQPVMLGRHSLQQGSAAVQGPVHMISPWSSRWFKSASTNPPTTLPPTCLLSPSPHDLAVTRKRLYFGSFEQNLDCCNHDDDLSYHHPHHHDVQSSNGPTTASYSSFERNVRQKYELPMTMCNQYDKQPSSRQHQEEERRGGSPAMTIMTSPTSKRLHFRDFQSHGWTDRYREAVAFKIKYGHCRIPEDYPENVVLGRWAKRQRSHYRDQFRQREQPHQLVVHHGDASTASGGSATGSCVDMVGGVESTMKEDGGGVQNGTQLERCNPLTEERIRLLDDIGFVWDLQATDWFKRYEELVAFKNMHGHVDIPHKFPSNQSLSNWIRTQRRRFSKGSMPQDRVKLLSQIGLLSATNKSCRKKRSSIIAV